MHDPSAVMDREVQSRLDLAFEAPELAEPAEKLFDPEARFELAKLGRHPAKLRNVAIALMPPTPRLILLGAGIVEYEEGHRPRWVLTNAGRVTAEILASALAGSPTVDSQETEAEYEHLLNAAEQEIKDAEQADLAGQAAPARPGLRRVDHRARRLLRRFGRGAR